MPIVKLDQINQFNGQIIQLMHQNADLNISNVRPPHLADQNSLAFVSKKTQFDQAFNQGTLNFIILKSLYSQIDPTLFTKLNIWTCHNIQLAMSQVLKLFDQNLNHLKIGIHPTAVIHETAEVSPQAHIGPYCVIGAHAKIGADTILTSHIYVGPYCTIGQRCVLAPFVSIGQDGFGFVTDQNLQHHKIPQIGKVVIEDDCEFGAHCAVDRATLTDTLISKGSKFDNFCHIAHNVQIGENALAAAGFIVAGSTVIGKNLTTAGGVHITGHLQIAPNVILSGRAGVSHNITESGVYGGFPLEPHQESIKTLASLPQIKKLRKQVRKILKHLQLNEEE